MDRAAELEPGDLLAFAGHGRESQAIRLFTCSRYSHVAGLARVPRRLLTALLELEDGRLTSKRLASWHDRSLLFESTTLTRESCAITGRRIEGVQAHDPWPRIESYDGAVWRLRIHPDWRLSDEEHDLLSRYLLSKIGVAYDRRGAALSAGKLLKQWLRNPEQFHYVFCSKLWAGALERIDRYPPVNANRVNPGDLIRKVIDYGYYLPPERLK